MFYRKLILAVFSCSVVFGAWAVPSVAQNPKGGVVTRHIDDFNMSAARRAEVNAVRKRNSQLIDSLSQESLQFQAKPNLARDVKNLVPPPPVPPKLKILTKRKVDSPNFHAGVRTVSKPPVQGITRDLRTSANPFEFENVTVVTKTSGKVFEARTIKNLDVSPTVQRADKRAPSMSGDGKIFVNDRSSELKRSLLPEKPAGYYSEWNVATPGVKGPGAQRIIAGKSGEIYYTPDHYAQFWRLR